MGQNVAFAAFLLKKSFFQFDFANLQTCKHNNSPIKGSVNTLPLHR
jgi:hypothetical protein